jgi:hypothetical protein
MVLKSCEITSRRFMENRSMMTGEIRLEMNLDRVVKKGTSANEVAVSEMPYTNEISPTI